MKVYVTNENNRLLRSLNDGVDLTKWINDQITRGYISSGVSSLASLTDVNLTGLQPDYVLTYDAVSGKWVPRFNAATAGNPAGTNGQIQFNNDGVFGASSSFVWNNTTTALTVGTSLSFGSSSRINLAGGSSAQHISVASNTSQLQIRGRGTVTNANTYTHLIWTQEANTKSTTTSEDVGLTEFKDLSFSPTSGNANYSLLKLNTTINQTGGANGISRALLISPTLTSASNFRSIEWNNNTGFGLYGSGTAKNFLAGNLGLGVDPTARLHIKGSGDTNATSGFLYEQATGVYRVGITDDGSFKVYSTNHPSSGVTIRGYVPGGGGSTTLISSITGGHHSSTGLYTSGAYGVRAINVLGYSAGNEFYSGVFTETTVDSSVGLISRGAIIIDRTATTALSTRSSSASLEVQSTTKGFLLPRMTTSQKDAITSPATGLQVFDTTLNQINVYNGTSWVGVGSSTIPAVATVTATSGNIPAINLQSFPTGIFEVDMAAAGSNVTFNAPTNPVNGGVYTFRFTNVTAHNIDFPASFLDQTGAVYDGNTTLLISQNSFFTSYFNGTNYICGKEQNIYGQVTISKVPYAISDNQLADSKMEWDNVSNQLTFRSVFNIRGENQAGFFRSVLAYDGTTTLSSRENSNLLLRVGSSTNPLIITGNGQNIGIGETGASLAGKLHVRGSGDVNGVNAVVVRSWNHFPLLEVQNGGLINIGKNVGGATQPTATIQVNPSVADADVGIALVSKGTGAITADVPDGAVTGGNARGIYAIDLQMLRDHQDQVASGPGSSILSGYYNRAIGNTSIVAGGQSNRAIGGNSNSILGGQSNQITAWDRNTIVGGQSNTISGTSTGAFIGGGSSNTASADNAVVAGGNNNRATATAAAVLGGQQNSALATYSTVVGGLAGVASLSYQTVTNANGVFAYAGDNQTSSIMMKAIITGQSAAELFIAGSTRLVITPVANTTARIWNARVQCVAIIADQANGTIANGSATAMNFDVVIKRTSTGGTVFVSTPTRTLHVHDTNMSNADFTINIDSGNNALTITFTPPSGAGTETKIRAGATLYLTELGY
jgi:hypothetical protein